MDNSAVIHSATPAAGASASVGPAAARMLTMGRPPTDLVAFVNRAVDSYDDDAAELGFHPRLFCQLALPYKEPTDTGRPWRRRNGNVTLTIRPAVETGPDGEDRYAFPSGSVPRLLLTWLATEVQRSDRPDTNEILLGENIAGFMRQLGMGNGTGGKSGSRARLRRQMNLLFDAVITAEVHGDATHDIGANWRIADRKSLWWSDTDQNADQRSLLPSTVRLSPEFYAELRDHPVPVEMRALRALQSNPMALDIYTWLTHRNSYARRRSQIKWEQLHQQFGSNTAFDTKRGRWQFRDSFTRNLALVCTWYPAAQIDVLGEGVIVHPAPTHVRPRALVRPS